MWHVKRYYYETFLCLKYPWNADIFLSNISLSLLLHTSKNLKFILRTLYVLLNVAKVASFDIYEQNRYVQFK